jgi:hypothetical protein
MVDVPYLLEATPNQSHILSFSSGSATSHIDDPIRLKFAVTVNHIKPH